VGVSVSVLFLTDSKTRVYLGKYLETVDEEVSVIVIATDIQEALNILTLECGRRVVSIEEIASSVITRGDYRIPYE
jgi:hypothetical protein